MSQMTIKQIGQLTLETLARINSVLFYTLWTTAPILVSITSFFVYVMTGHVLTFSTAFTVCLRIRDNPGCG